MKALFATFVLALSFSASASFVCMSASKIALGQGRLISKGYEREVKYSVASVIIQQEKLTIETVKKSCPEATEGKEDFCADLPAIILARNPFIQENLQGRLSEVYAIMSKNSELAEMIEDFCL